MTHQSMHVLELPMRYRLRDFCPSKTVHSRISNALWIEYGGSPWDMPQDWEPERIWAASLDLNLIPNLGPMSVAILRNWLVAGDSEAGTLNQGGGGLEQAPDNNPEDDAR
ncbi:hypothetical protein M8997_019035 [Phyllobacterium sp. 21LDTY02-6]|uniref:hypothetical protein n=1 Tax=Phyllobacterium sp. 21LDTY02-6 TaxID=2944903 RepID=UPI0020215996|nr:hypothetical protein [Phyllobacterium sp. 21LDTY02-6]MCO4319286.1 hypothetical protein [Phyllobacterium sp. 21LDTY02-6]